MKRWGMSFIALCFLGLAQGSDIERKLGPGLRALIGGEASYVEKAGIYPEIEEGGWVRVFVRGESPSTAIDNVGGVVQSDFGHLVTARVPWDEVLNLAALDDASFVRLGRKVFQRNDLAVKDMRADVAHAGQSPLSRAYTGEGVVVGIIDTGIDPLHRDFQNRDGTTRIRFLWDQMSNDGTAPTGFSYGTEWTHDDIDNGLCSHEDLDGHGTHVSGTAAGNGSEIEQYKGVAPDAELIVVALDFQSSVGVIDAANYIYQKADELGMPCVINASLGWHQGMHDGSGEECQAIGTLVDASPGRSFFAAAGNEGSDYIHVSYPASSDAEYTYFHAEGDPLIWLYVRVPNTMLNTMRFSVGVDEADYNPMDGTGGPTAYLGSTPWYTTQDVLNDPDYEILERMEFDGKERGRVTISLDRFVPGEEATGLLIFIDDSDMVWDDDTGTVEDLDLWRFNVWGGTSDLHVWVADVGVSYKEDVADPQYRPPDNDYSVGMPAVGEKIIAVGASVTRTQWTAVDGNTYTVDGTIGDLADFSSRGPTAGSNERMKPDLVAPGSMMISAVPSTAYEDELWDEKYFPEGQTLYGLSSGTSMACPAAAGAAALMYQSFGHIGQAQLRQKLQEGARSDGFTGGALPNNHWGYGKMDVVNMLTGTSVGDDERLPSDFILDMNYPNPFNGSTTISYMIPTSAHVELCVYSTDGRLVDTLESGFVRAGRKQVQWDATDVGSGVYFYRLTAGGRSLTGKCLLMK